MMTPEQVALEIYDVLEDVQWEDFRDFAVPIIAKALAAQRERCAKIIDNAITKHLDLRRQPEMEHKGWVFPGPPHKLGDFCEDFGCSSLKALADEIRNDLLEERCQDHPSK